MICGLNIQPVIVMICKRVMFFSVLEVYLTVWNMQINGWYAIISVSLQNSLVLYITRGPNEDQYYAVIYQLINTPKMHGQFFVAIAISQFASKITKD